MPISINEINNSKARKILQSWLGTHKIKTGELLQDIANHLENEAGQPIKYSAISPWFSDNSKQAKLMPVNRAIELKKYYPDFPLGEYLRAFVEFYEEYNPSEQKLHGFYGFIEAYGDIVGLGYLAQDYNEYFSILTEVEDNFTIALPKTLSDEQKKILERALGEIMFLELDYEKAADVNTYLASMLSKVISPNKKMEI